MPQAPETPLQFDMFTGTLIDNRTDKQKRQAKEAAQPKPVEMFSTAEIAQFGVKAHPLLPISDNTCLMLIPEDHHTPEEIDQDIQWQAEKLTNPLFPDAQEQPPEPPVALLSAWCETTVQIWSIEALLYRSNQIEAKQGEPKRYYAAIFEASKRQETPQKTDTPATEAVLDWDIEMGWFSLAEVVDWRPDLAPALAALTDYDLSIIAQLTYQQIFETYRLVFAQALMDYLKTCPSPKATTQPALPHTASQQPLL